MEKSIFNNNLLFLGFNQDASCVSIGTRNGYRIFNCQPFGRNIFSTDGGIGLIEMLFCTSLVGLVGGGDNPAFSPCHLKLWNTKTASVICELKFDTEILGVKMNRKRLIVVLAGKLHVYDLDSMKNLQTLDIATLGRNYNNQPLCELSPDDGNSFLALPANSACGDVFLYDCLNLVEFRWINAHKAPLTALKFSLDGSMLATASETGTVVRIFRVPSGEKLYSFRRGTYSATVYSLAFNEHSNILAASSSNGTVHVFRLGNEHIEEDSSVHSNNNNINNNSNGSSNNIDNEDDNVTQMTTSTTSTTVTSEHGDIDNNDTQSKTSSFISMATSNAYAFLEKRRMMAGSLLPVAISDLVEPCRSYAVARLKNHHVISVCALAKGLLCVVTSDGHFCQYNIDHTGECQLVFEMNLHINDIGGKDDQDGFLTRSFKKEEQEEDHEEEISSDEKN